MSHSRARAKIFTPAEQLIGRKRHLRSVEDISPAVEMSANDKPYEPAMVKEVLCKHFNTRSTGSQLTIREKQFLGLGGPRIHYYYLTLTADNVRHRAFGKISPKNQQEYRALEYLMRSGREAKRVIARPIGLLQNGDYSMLLLECLDGYSNPFSVLHVLRLSPNTAANITQVGKDILDRLYQLQEQCQTIYTPLSLADIAGAPGQPQPISLLAQLEAVKSISSEAKAQLRSGINRMVNNQVRVRRSVVHGQLGIRNIMMRRSNIAFIDWEYMQTQGLSIYDACYMVIMLVMRSAQLLIPRGGLEKISTSLFHHIRCLEERLTTPGDAGFVQDGLWFATSMAMIDTLWQYETNPGSRLKALIKQKPRKTRYLVRDLERHAKNGWS